jgi:hypothetical protein
LKFFRENFELAKAEHAQIFFGERISQNKKF